MSDSRIPFNRPVIAGREVEYISDAIARGHISGDGFYTRKCHDALEGILPGSKVLLTTSCTHALELAALLLSIEPGDEVIVPSFTFVSTINAFVLRGAQPVFLDIRRDTLNLDERLLASRITTRTKAIVPVHYAGVSCEMDEILRMAADKNIPVVEDNAHGLFGTYRGRPLGTIGRLATLSFHETKNLTCGEGGALLVNDAELLPRAEILREKGTNRSRFFRGQVDKYTWMDVGSSYLPSDMLAAFLYGQLEVREKIQNRRQTIWRRYAVELADWAASRGACLPHVPEHCVQPGHLFFLLLPDLEIRQRLVRHLDARGIHAVFHYLPLHLSEMGRRFGGSRGDCPVTEEVSDRLLRLPLYYGLSDDDQTRVLDAVREF